MNDRPTAIWRCPTCDTPLTGEAALDAAGKTDAKMETLVMHIGLSERRIPKGKKARKKLAEHALAAAMEALLEKEAKPK